MEKSFKLKSNKKNSYRILAQIAASVPKRVRFDSIELKGPTSALIKGSASSDQDILKLVENLNKQKLIEHASIASMNLSKSKSAGSPQVKVFRVACKFGEKT